MKRNIALFILTILLSIPFWWIIDNIEGDYTAQVSQALTNNQENNIVGTEEKNYSSYSNKKLTNFDIDAKAALSIRIENGKDFILFKKNPKERLPIASLTKLMVSLVSFEIYDPSQLLYISKEAVDQEENFGNLRVGERLSVNDLIHIALMESSNDAAYALSQGIFSPDNRIGRETFVKMMNIEAQKIKMEDTFFFNPTGLDGNVSVNYSTAEDLLKLVKYIINNKSEIIEISGKKKYIVLSQDGKVHHIISQNRNELVGKIPDLIGGKTGYTEEAGGCIITILKNRKGDYLINIILGAKNPEERFIQTRKLIHALRENNLW